MNIMLEPNFNLIFLFSGSDASATVAVNNATTNPGEAAIVANLPKPANTNPGLHPYPT